MQDEKNTSTSQSISEEELTERLISLINGTAKQLEILMNDIGGNEAIMKRFFSKIDGETVESAAVLQHFNQLVMRGAMAVMVEKAIADVEQNGTRYRDAFESACKKMGIDAQIIEVSGIIP